MAVFSRRRLQAMLDELRPLLKSRKINDLVARIESLDTSKALAGELELGVLWGMHQIADIEIEPELPGVKARPEAFSKNLLRTGPAAVEITSLSDDTFSGEKDMRRAANIIDASADRIRAGSSRHLHYEFAECAERQNGRLNRFRRVTERFQITPPFQHILSSWLSTHPPRPREVRLEDGEIDVRIVWEDKKVTGSRIFCTMPAVAYDVEKNVLASALRRKKKKQLSGLPAGFAKCIIVADAGCDLLRSLFRLPMGPDEKQAPEIIGHFLEQSSLDVVLVLVAVSEETWSGGLGRTSTLRWRSQIFTRPGYPKEAAERLSQLERLLPKPYGEGYRVRSLHRQGAFHPQRLLRKLGTVMTHDRDGTMTIKVSARLVHELLAGRISSAEFGREAFRRVPNQFEFQLGRGLLVHDVKFEDGGVDEDDDFLIFELAEGAGVARLALVSGSSTSTGSGASGWSGRWAKRSAGSSMLGPNVFPVL